MGHAITSALYQHSQRVSFKIGSAVGAEDGAEEEGAEDGAEEGGAEGCALGCATMSLRRAKKVPNEFELRGIKNC